MTETILGAGLVALAAYGALRWRREAQRRREGRRPEGAWWV